MNKTLRSVATTRLPEIGERQGRWTVLRTDLGMPTNRNRRGILCRCDCGVEKVIDFANFARGKTKSCGCREYNGKLTPRHRKSTTKLYGVWKAMLGRCFNSNDRAFPYYGKRGIIVCNEWAESFESFYQWSITNGYQPRLQIDRIDNNLGYCPANCRWITSAVNMRNTAANVIIEAFGEVKCATDWSSDPRCHVSPTTIKRRIANGFSAEEAIAVPPFTRH